MQLELYLCEVVCAKKTGYITLERGFIAALKCQESQVLWGRLGLRLQRALLGVRIEHTTFQHIRIRLLALKPITWSVFSRQNKTFDERMTYWDFGEGLG